MLSSTTDLGKRLAGNGRCWRLCYSLSLSSETRTKISPITSLSLRDAEGIVDNSRRRGTICSASHWSSTTSHHIGCDSWRNDRRHECCTFSSGRSAHAAGPRLCFIVVWYIGQLALNRRITSCSSPFQFPTHSCYLLSVLGTTNSYTLGLTRPFVHMLLNGLLSIQLANVVELLFSGTDRSPTFCLRHRQLRRLAESRPVAIIERRKAIRRICVRIHPLLLPLAGFRKHNTCKILLFYVHVCDWTAS